VNTHAACFAEQNAARVLLVDVAYWLRDPWTVMFTTPGLNAKCRGLMRS
jgi:hypothetical protein